MRSAAAISAAVFLAACVGDDVTVDNALGRVASPRDATVDPAFPDARPRKDVTEPSPDGGSATCVPASRATVDASVNDADSATVDATASDATVDGGACVARTVAAFDFGASPRVTFGGARPGAWQIGKASTLFGPALDRLGRAGDCFLAARPGARYRLDEEAWAELDPVDLRDVAGCAVSMSVWVWYELEVGLDAANVVVSAEGGPFETVGMADGPSLYDSDDFLTSDCGGGDCQVFMQSVWSTFAPGSTSWREARFDLARFAGKSNVRVRFQFHTDGFANYQGIYLQDVVLRVP